MEKVMNQELLRIVDSISRDKNIDKEEIFMDIEAALLSADPEILRRSRR